jgi:hypothetical protein
MIDNSKKQQQQKEMKNKNKKKKERMYKLIEMDGLIDL